MKTLTNRLTMVAASALVLGTMVYGQPDTKVEIPFEFHTGDATLPAGNYRLSATSAVVGRILKVTNDTSHHAVFASAVMLDPTRVVQPSVLFACQNGYCTLREVRMAYGTLVYARPRNVAREQGEVSLVSIPLKTRNGD